MGQLLGGGSLRAGHSLPRPWRGWRQRSSTWLRGGEEAHGSQKEVK